MTDELVLVGDHAENLASGALIGPGDRVKASELADEDQYLVDEGRLRYVDSFEQTAALEGDALKARAAELKIEGRSRMSADELRDAVTAREHALEDERIAAAEAAPDLPAPVETPEGGDA